MAKPIAHRVDWLSGTVRRWGALLGAVATIIVIATFAAAEHLSWTWPVIGGLVLLAVAAAATASGEHRKRLAAEGQGQGTPDLDRLISDGHAMKQGALWDEWPAWRRRAHSHVRARFGLREALAFSRAGNVVGPAENREAIERQVSHLEGLRERQ
jgi:hypothetical protein